jgi:CHAT domain-containing protein/Tfp pilus assembly protein PilF
MVMVLATRRVGWLVVVVGGLLLAPARGGAQDADKKELLDARNKAAALAKQGKAGEAIERYEKALALAPKVYGSEHTETAGLMNSLALLYRDQGQYAKAEPLFLRSLQIREEKLGKEHPDVAQSLGSLAWLYHLQRQDDKAEPLLRGSLQIYEARWGKDHTDVARILNSLALLYREQGRHDKAEPLFLRSLQIREAKLGKDHPDVAQSLGSLAWLYYLQRRYAGAEPLYQRSLQIYETKLGRDNLDVARIVHNLALLYQAQGQYAQAEPLFLRSLQIREAKLGKDHPDVADSLNALAMLHHAEGEYAKAEPLLQRSLQIREAKLGKDHPDVATSLHNLAWVYYFQGRYAEAEPLYQHSLKIREEKLGKDHPRVADSLNNLALLYWQQGQDGKAEPLYQRSLQVKEEKLGKDHPDVATTLDNLALLYWQQGQYAKAEPLLQRSLQIKEDKLGKDYPHIAYTLDYLAGLYQDQGQYAKAEPLFLRGLQIREAKLGKDHPDVAKSLNNLAALYETQGQYAKAEPLLQRSLEIREAKLGKDHPFVTLSLNPLAWLYYHQGQYAKAEPLFQRSLQISEAKRGKDHPLVASSLNGLATVYRAQGQYDKAEPLYQRSLQIREAKLGKDHPKVVDSLNNLVKLYGGTQRWPQAAEAAEAARRGLRRHVSQVLPALAETEQLTFLHEKVEGSWHLALALALARADDDALATLSAGWLLNGKGLSQQALAERALLARDSADPKVADIARELSDVRARLAALTHGGVPPEQEERIRQERAALAEKEERLSKQLGEAAGRPVRADPWVELAEVRKALAADAVLIDIARIRVWDFAKGKSQPAHYVAWIIPGRGDRFQGDLDKGKVRLLDLGPADRVETAVQTVRKALKDAPQRIATDGEPDSEKELRRPLEALSRLVLYPLLEHIGEAKRWVVSPDANLWLVPWSALLLKDGRYAVERYEIRYAVSGRDLAQNTVKAATGRPVLLADPDYDLRPARVRTDSRPPQPGPAEAPESRGILPRVGRLRGTAAEAQAVTPRLTRWTGSEPRVYLREQAVEGVFKALARPRVVMLSTHGFFLAADRSELPDHADSPGEGPTRPRGKLPENPLLRCGLLLAGCNQRDEAAEEEDDGVLTGLEIVGTDLRGTELVVLSACETGLGDVHNGEGVAGLRQAFQLAGAQSVLASLWSVEDRETARLMVDFFAQVADGKTKAEALRQAQLARLQARRDRQGAAHPFFWAAFTLTGQGP